MRGLLKVRNIPLTAALIIAIVLSNLFEIVTGIAVIPNQRVVMILTELLILCAVADLLRLFVRFVPIPGAEPAKRVLFIMVMLCSTALVVKVDSFSLNTAPFSSRTLAYECENQIEFTIKPTSADELQIIVDDTVVRTVERAKDFPYETYNDGHTAYTFWSGYGNELEVTEHLDEVDGPRSTMCEPAAEIKTIGHADQATQDRIRALYRGIDADPSLVEKSIVVDPYVKGWDSSYGAGDLIGYFKDGKIQKIYQEVDLGNSTKKYLYYFENGQLAYAYEERNDYSSTAPGHYDKSKLEFTFGINSIFQNGKMVQTLAQGKNYDLELQDHDALSTAKELVHLLTVGDPTKPNETSKVYTNADLGFSFSYPNSWSVEERKVGGQGYREQNMDMVLNLHFVDPVEEKKELSDQNRLLPARNIFIRVYKTDMPLKDWLMQTYKGPQGSELSRYEIGRAIELSGQKGYFSSTGCCSGVDDAYVVKKGGHIYEFGSNSFASSASYESIIQFHLGAFSFRQ